MIFCNIDMVFPNDQSIEDIKKERPIKASIVGLVGCSIITPLISHGGGEATDEFATNVVSC